MAHGATVSALEAAQTPQQLLAALKDLKNSVIGNTWKKVEVAEDARVMQLLMEQLGGEIPTSASPSDSTSEVAREILQETAVIVGALGTVGPLTIQPLLAVHASERLLSLIRSLASTSYAAKLTPVLLRSLRNVQVSTADVVWGHMWGVGSERKVVGTGLEGMEVNEAAGDRSPMDDRGNSPKGKGKAKEGACNDQGMWTSEARRSLGLIFEDDNLDALLGLLQPENSRTADHQVLLPLYQMLARLIALPSHRRALARKTASYPLQIGDTASSSSRAKHSQSSPFMLPHIMGIIAEASGNGNGGTFGRRNPRLLEAALDLLAAMVKGEAEVAGQIREWGMGAEGATAMSEESAVLEEEVASGIPGFMGELVHMMTTAGPGVRIAAASCLTNVLKADKAPRTSDLIRSRVIKTHLLDIVYKLLETETYEERIKLCFVLAALVSDDAHIQSGAATKGCPGQLLSMVPKVEEDEASGEIGLDTLARHREGILLALAALSFQHEPTRISIADHEPSIFPFIRKSLSHASYGVRASACQLTRALSRTVAILRTSLVDSGVGEEVLRTLKREYQLVNYSPAWGTATLEGNQAYDQAFEEMEQHGMVEVAALATICNLITDFSPLRAKIISAGYLDIICQSASSVNDAIAVNALWALKNLLFHAPDSLKVQVVTSLRVEGIRRLLEGSTPLPVRAQALCVTQNLFADATTAEMVRWLDTIGEGELMSVLQVAAQSGSVDLTIPALYALSNLAFGNERIRQCIMSRVQLVEALSQALDHRLPSIQVPALRAIKHLVESTTRTRKPRQAVVEAFQPYHLKPRLADMHENAVDFDVRQGAKALLDALERGSGRESVGPTAR